MTYLILKAIHRRSLGSCTAQSRHRGADLSAPPHCGAQHDLAGRDTGDADRMAQYAQGTFWCVLPSLPMFLLIPALLKRGFAFWTALAAGWVLTIVLYMGMAALLARGDIRP